MNTYEYYEQMETLCKVRARELKDEHLKTFYTNASKGFEIKKMNLTLSEVL